MSNQDLKEEIQTVLRKQSEMAESLKSIFKHLQDNNTQSSHTYPLDEDTDVNDIETKIDAAAQFKFRLVIIILIVLFYLAKIIYSSELNTFYF